MKTSKSNCNSNFKKWILRFFDFCRRCEEKERLKEQLLSNFSESLQSSSSHLLRTSTPGSKLAFTFVCLFVVAIVDRRRSDLCVLFLSVSRRVVIYSYCPHASSSSSSSSSREHLRSFSDFESCSILHKKRDNAQQQDTVPAEV